MDRSKNLEAVRNYTYLERRVESDLDSAGNVKRREIRTYDVTYQEGSPYRRLVRRNDRPLLPKEQQQEDEKLRRSIEQRQKETPAQREQRIADWHRRQERQREPIQEIPDAFQFRIVGEEILNGRHAWVIEALPRPEYKPRSSGAAFFPKVKARLWIDKDDYQWAKVEMETLDTISVGGILLRLGKGGRLLLEQLYLNNEVWLPKRVSLAASGRIFLVKGIRKTMEMTYSDYRKFQVDSRVVSTAEK